MEGVRTGPGMRSTMRAAPALSSDAIIHSGFVAERVNVAGGDVDVARLCCLPTIDQSKGCHG